jgi:predicted PurR-regulated permease PerM
MPRPLAVTLVMGAILLVLAGLAAIVVPAVVDEVTSVRDELPEDAREAEDFLDDFGIEVELEERAENINWNRLISGEAALDYGQKAFSVAVALFTIFFLTAYLLADTSRMNRFIYQFVTPGHEPDVERVLASLRRVVGGYIRGQLITSASITFFTFCVLTAADVPNAIAFAVLAGFVDIIPIVGAVIAVIMPTLAAFQESPEQAIIVVVLLLAYQQFEDRILVPRVYGETLNLPPVLVLIAILVGGTLYGIAGVLLALPAAAAARVGLDYYLERRGVGLREAIPGDEPAAPEAD